MNPDTIIVGSETYVREYRPEGRVWLHVLRPEIYSEFRRISCSDQTVLMLDEILSWRTAAKKESAK